MSSQNFNFFSLTIQKIDRTESGARIVRLAVRDRFSKKRYTLQRWALVLFSNGLTLYLKTKPDMPADAPNNYARYMLRLTPAMRAWAQHMPGGFATYYVHNPDRRRIDNNKRLDLITKALFQHSYDGRGIRAGAHTMTWFLSKNLVDQGRIRWVSVASGTGQPTFDASTAFVSPIDHLLIDSDQDALDFSQKLAEEYDKNEDTLRFENLNVIKDAQKMDEVIAEFNPNCIDAMGLFEYLTEDEIVALLRRLYAVLPVGGVMVFTSMRDTHPNLDVHKRAVAWPGVQERKWKFIEALILEAGVSSEELTILLPDDDVYGIYGLVKSQ